ncbi:hypothetical protein A5715_13435 [Mycolicibacter heraklionensis]|nr:hypothetical protein A5715_13435 [Mycolicibacter heraklionensis]
MSESVSQPGALTVEPFGVSLNVAPEEKLLQAILRNGNYVPFGCNHGGCGTCAARVIDGDLEQAVDQGADRADAGTASDEEFGPMGGT